MPMKHSPGTPSIYVACLASYNAGTLHGRWIECDRSASEIRDEIKKILKQSSQPYAEEWAIHDYRYFGSVRLSEYECLDDIAAFAEAYEEWGELFSELVNHCGGLSQLDRAKCLLQDEYAGEGDSLADWAESFLEETGGLENVPQNLRSYIDFDSYGNDMDISGDIFTLEVNGKTHVFWNR
ncbi:MAG: antirestriction protein ArdA [Deltaproteobacteria bacterium]|nr:antirestriction protein ArdA [Deltaproteobacteria bacterium]